MVAEFVALRGFGGANQSGGTMRKAPIVLISLLIMAIVIGAVGCGGDETTPTAPPTATPTPPPAPTPTPTPARTPEPTIPADFTTYTDELGLFSISYPAHWELAISEIGPVEQWVKEYIESIEANIPMDKVITIFAAVAPTDMGFSPNVNINIAPLPSGTWTLDAVVREQVGLLKDFLEEYRELSRVRTTIGGREAVILECESTYPSMGTLHHLYLLTLAGNSMWTVTCTTAPEQFKDYEDDLNAIVRSLRILK